MWKVECDRAYPFRHNQTNLFPPRLPPLSIPPPLTPNRLPLYTCFEESDEEEVPIVFHSPLIRNPEKVSYTFLPQPSTPPPFSFNMEPLPTPSSLAPANLTNLLQDVLGIMNTIMNSRAAVEEEDAILQEFVELVVIMQEEAELLIEVSDLVEEYCGEVEVEVEVKEIEEWCFELGLGRGDIGDKGDIKKLRHEREDSGVGLDDDSMLDEKSESGVGFMDDKSLEEVKPPTRPSESLIDFYMDDRSLEVTKPKARRDLEAQTVWIKPTQKAVPKDSIFEQKPQASRTSKKDLSEEKKVIRKKGKDKRSTLHFRDSGLDLRGPRGSPQPRAPRWI